MQLLKMKMNSVLPSFLGITGKKGICLGERPRIHIIYGFPK